MTRISRRFALIGLIGLVLDVLVRRTETLRSVRWGFRTEDS